MPPPPWLTSAVWPTLPPDITSRSQARVRCSPSRFTTTPVTAVEPLACHGWKPARYSMPASSIALPSASRRESATASTFTPPSARSSAAASPSSLDVSTTACSDGISRNWFTSRRAPLSAQREALLDQRNVLALLGRLGGRLQPGLAAADHQHVDVTVHLVEALGSAMGGVELAEAGCVAQDLLVERPGPARVDEGLVVEADLHAEAWREPAHQVQELAPQRGPRIQVLHVHALLDRGHAGAHGRLAVHLDEAVRALAGAAHQATRAVVLEGAREHARAGREEGRGDGVARIAGDGAALPLEGHLLRAVAQLALSLRQPLLSHRPAPRSRPARPAAPPAAPGCGWCCARPGTTRGSRMSGTTTHAGRRRCWCGSRGSGTAPARPRTSWRARSPRRRTRTRRRHADRSWDRSV